MVVLRQKRVARGLGDCLKYRERGWNRKEGKESKDFKNGGKLDQEMGALKGEGGLEPSYELWPADFGRAVESSTHHFFSDTSEDKYGQVSDLRLVNSQGVIRCVLLIEKARVSPLKYVSIPRLKLVAATLSVKIALLLREELDIEITKEYFWTDSKVALGYISNSSKRFKIFVANRV